MCLISQVLLDAVYVNRVFPLCVSIFLSEGKEKRPTFDGAASKKERKKNPLLQARVSLREGRLSSMKICSALHTQQPTFYGVRSFSRSFALSSFAFVQAQQSGNKRVNESALARGAIGPGGTRERDH